MNDLLFIDKIFVYEKNQRPKSAKIIEANFKYIKSLRALVIVS